MPETEHHHLVRFVRQQVGDDLRGILRHRDDTVELLYRRDDVDAGQFKDRVELTIRQAQTKRLHTDDTDGRIGEHIELFDGVVLLYLFEGPNEASIFSIDMAVAENLARFLDRCRDVVGLQRRETRVQSDSHQHERGSGET